MIFGYLDNNSHRKVLVFDLVGKISRLRFIYENYNYEYQHFSARRFRIYSREKTVESISWKLFSKTVYREWKSFSNVLSFEFVVHLRKEIYYREQLLKVSFLNRLISFVPAFVNPLDGGVPTNLRHVWNINLIDEGFGDNRKPFKNHYLKFYRSIFPSE